MMMRLENELRRYRHDFEAAQSEIRLDDVRTRRALEPPQLLSQPRGWMVAVGVAAAVLLFIGGATLGLGLLTRPGDLAGEPPLTVGPAITMEPATIPPTTTAEPAPPTTTAAPERPALFAAQLFTEEHGLHGGPILEVAVDQDGVVWAIGSALYRFDTGTWTQASDVVPANRIDWMVPAPGGGVLLGGSPSCTVALFNGVAWTNLDVPVMVRCSAKVANNEKTWIFGYDEDQAPTFVEVTATGVVSHPPGPVPPSFPVSELRLTFDVAPDGALWYGTADGAWRFDGDELMLHTLDAPEGCCPPSLAVGSDEDVWVQLASNVFWYSDGVWTRFAPADGVPLLKGEFSGPAAVIPTAGSDVWIVGTESVTRFDGTAWTTYAGAEAIEQGVGLGHSGVSVSSPDGSTWMLTYASGGASWLARHAEGQWEGGSVETMKWAEPSPGSVSVNLRSFFNQPLAVAPDGSAWIATTGGVTRITAVD